MKKIINSILISVFCFGLLSGCSYTKNKDSNSEMNKNSVEVSEENIDFSDKFNGINGCAVLYNLSENKYSFYNRKMAEKKVSPYSTFKVISTLSGLHNNVLKDENTTMNYDGTEYPNSEWNEDLSLKNAFQKSCIWYFRKVIDEVGKDEISKELKDLKYGNCDISQWNGSNINPYEELNGFWLDSSLKVSPAEQVKVLTKIIEGNSIYSEKEVNILKQVMLVKDNGKQKIYGKTGSGPNGKAWFIGCLEKENQRLYFAVYLDDDKNEQVSGQIAKEIALRIIK